MNEDPQPRSPSPWVTDLLEVIRGAVRPIITVMVVGTYLAFLGMGKFDAALEIAQPLVLLVVTFWFVERMVRRGLR